MHKFFYCKEWVELTGTIKPKILIIENDVNVASDMQEQLRNMGYTGAQICSSGEEAIGLMPTLKPDLVLINVMLSGKMNRANIEKYISINYGVPVMFFNSYDNAAVLDKKEVCPTGYVARPIEAEDFHHTIELLLYKHKMDREKFAETRRLKNEFLANMTHEIRTPLNGIIGFSELLYQEKLGALSAEYKEYIHDVLVNAQHLSRLTDNIFRLVEVESKKIIFYPKRVNMQQLIHDVSESLSNELQENKLNLQIHINPELHEIIADPDRLKQVLYCYLSNAIKFSHSHKSIEVFVYPETTVTLRIDVKDQGIGIAKEDLAELFLPFHQLDSSIEKKYPGPGLGLALAKNLVEAQGGRIGVESELSHGSTFYIVLPWLGA